MTDLPTSLALAAADLMINHGRTDTSADVVLLRNAAAALKDPESAWASAARLETALRKAMLALAWAAERFPEVQAAHEAVEAALEHERDARRGRADQVRTDPEQALKGPAPMPPAARALRDAVAECHGMLLSEADTRAALFKAEDLLREAVIAFDRAEQQARPATPDVGSA